MRSGVVAAGRKSANAAILSAIVLLAPSVDAAGLGKLTVLSSLGQPLRAEIELTSVGKEEAGSLTARLAPMDAYRQANIDFNPALQSLQFSIEQRSGRQFIRLTSTQPINEPFVDMLLELGTSGSRLLREYTFLLDPAEVKSAQTPQTVAPASPAGIAQQPARSASAPAVVARPASPPAPSEAPASPAPAAQAPAGPSAAPKTDEYRVKNGDSLAQIATRVKPEAVSLDQMLVSLFNANPEAFVGKNMNRLRAGEILKVPDAKTANAVTPQEARQVIRAQAADFNAYRSRLASQVAASPSKKAVQDSRSTTGKITSSVDESMGSADNAQDKLRLSKAGASGAASAPANPGTEAGEESVAKDKALAEADSRVKELEKNLSDLQALLQLKNKELAERQQLAMASEAKPAAAPAAPAAELPGPSAATAPAAPVKETAADKGGAAGAATIPQSPSSQAAKPPAAKPAVTAPEPEPGFVDTLLASPMLLPAAGFLTLALGAFSAYQRRRRKPADKALDGDAGPGGLKANSLFASTGGQSVDTSNSVFNSSFSPSASQLDANEVDPVAEADVYIAYGRDAQAEEILREALRGQPERHAVRLKLLEIYAGRKDLRAFETHATELYGNTKGQGDEWQQALRLGRSIDPRNPLYGGVRDAGDIDSKIADAESIMGAEDKPDELPASEKSGAGQSVNDAEEPVQSDGTSDEKSVLEFDDGAGPDAPIRAQPPADLLPPLDMPGSSEPAVAAADADREAAVSDTAQSDGARNETEAQSIAAFREQLDSLSFDLNSFPPKGDGEDIDKRMEIDATESITIDSLDFNLDVPETNKPVVAKDADQMVPGDDVPVLTTTAYTRPDARDGDRESNSLATADAVSSAPAIGDMMDFDLSGIDLNLPGKDADAALDADPSAAGSSADAVSNPEMATKLDLAAAYQEIGDKEGARELLDEVVQGGTPGQVAEARRMLEKLS